MFLELRQTCNDCNLMRIDCFGINLIFVTVVIFLKMVAVAEEVERRAPPPPAESGSSESGTDQPWGSPSYEAQEVQTTEEGEDPIT